ncbi:uncharacterized protein LOC110232357 [Exaiptasia diaphana]|uniref:Uncharacterized protein n=1 Tax=Exaiptasia diaphana TaxID=2652724 RepID=A0A913WRY2_EXADI|nr:uncharacterized protein LOC110232357 [Exaiptasia diaphana]
MDLRKLKKSRAAHRVFAKRLVEQGNALYGKDASEREEFEAQELLGALEDKMSRLQEVDNNIESLMADSEEYDENNLLQELEECAELSRKMNKVIMRLKSLVDDDCASTASSSTTVKKVHARLPKLEVKRFSGAICEWQEFWDSFESAVHSNDDLGDVDKFNYLRGLLQDSAKAAIAGFSLTSNNYKEAVELLKRRYGKKEVVQRAHMDGLLNAAPVFSDKDMARLRTFCDLVETHFRGLEALKMDSSTYSCIVVPALMEKLPETLRLTLTRGQKFLEWSIGDFVEKLRAEVELRENHKLGSSSSRNHRLRGGEKTMASGSVLVTN